MKNLMSYKFIRFRKIKRKKIQLTRPTLRPWFMNCLTMFDQDTKYCKLQAANGVLLNTSYTNSYIHVHTIGCVKLSSLWYKIIVLLRVLDYSQRKEEYLIIFSNSSTHYNRENNFWKMGMLISHPTLVPNNSE